MSERVVPEEGRRRRRPTKQGTVLSEELIVGTALRLIHEHGAAALTVRRLGAALGADPSALYRYFRDTDDLLLAVADELIGRTLRRFRPTGEWRADLRTLGLMMHADYQAHPQAAMLTCARVTGRENETRSVETILGVLRGAGFPDPEAVRVYHAFVDQTLAFAALDASTLALPAAARESEARAWQETYARLPADSHPNIAATAPVLVAEMRRSGYPAALEMVLAAAEARLGAVLSGAPPVPGRGAPARVPVRTRRTD
ncbi:TetR/AcrR family transcriptional regulator [Streptomyces sp. NPDC055287]